MDAEYEVRTRGLWIETRMLVKCPSSPWVGGNGPEVAIGSEPAKVRGGYLFASWHWSQRQDSCYKFQHGALPDSTAMCLGQNWSSEAVALREETLS